MESNTHLNVHLCPSSYHKLYDRLIIHHRSATLCLVFQLTYYNKLEMRMKRMISSIQKFVKFSVNTPQKYVLNWDLLWKTRRLNIIFSSS